MHRVFNFLAGMNDVKNEKTVFAETETLLEEFCSGLDLRLFTVLMNVIGV